MAFGPGPTRLLAKAGEEGHLFAHADAGPTGATPLEPMAPVARAYVSVPHPQNHPRSLKGVTVCVLSFIVFAVTTQYEH